MSNREGRADGGSAHGPFTAYGIGPEERRALVDAFDKAIETAGPDFGRSIKEMLDSVADAEPTSVMATMAMYLGSSPAGTNPEYERPLGIFQHHLEIAQAVLFRSGSANGSQPPARHLPRVAAAVKGFYERWVLLQAQKMHRAAGGAPRDLEAALLELRLHASAQRGWGYQSRMVPMLEQLLTPLDSVVQPRLGFAPGALPAWWVAMSDRVNTRLEEHRAAVRDAWEWPVDDGWLNRVAERFGGLPEPAPGALLAAAKADDKLRRGYVTQCSDLRVHEIYRFSLDELVELMPGAVEPAVVQRIADAWSMQPGEDRGVDIGALPLSNPVVGRPFVADGKGQWHLFCGWLLLHNPFELVERLIEDHDELFDTYMLRRAEFLEQRTADLLGQAFPAAAVERSLLAVDPADGKEYENDVLALVSSYAVVAEAKAGRLHPDARRGRGRALRERIDELLVRPSEQSLRLAERLENESGPVTFTRKADSSTLTVQASDVHRTLAVAVTLEPLADLLPRLAEVADAGLSERQADALAYNISLLDLELVVALLDHPSEILHYLGRRTEIERRTFLSGDEVDLLALYLQTGFNLGEREFSGEDRLDVTGLSDPIDTWHYRLEAGMEGEKPQPERTAWWERVLSRVESRGGPRWAEIGVSMCNVGPPEQEEFEAALRDLRSAVVAGKRKPADLVLFHNGPPQRRDVFAGLIATSPDRAARERQYEQAATRVLADHELARLTILVWTPLPIDPPYFALLLYDGQQP
jgi:hypothetical protein